jgi:L-iditol 2-dehydrogenase
MKAAVYLGGAKNIKIQDVPKPVLKDGEILMKVGAANLCGVDSRTYNHGDKKIEPPRILGHEFAGTVVEINHKDPGVALGDRITAYVVLPCGTCIYCKRGRANLCDTRTTISYQHDGAFAEYIAIPKQAVDNRHLFKIPDHVSFEEAALSEPLATVLNSHGKLEIGIKDTVVVLGAGPIGILHSLVSKIEGSNHVCIMDISEKRLKLAEQFGLDSYIQVKEDGSHVDAAKAMNDGLGPDVVIVANTAAASQVDALEMAGKGARVEFFGGLPKSNPFATLNTNLIHYREIVVSGSFSSKIEDFRNAMKLITSGLLPAKEIITHRFNLDDMLKAFDVIPTGEAIKVSIQPGL